MRIHLQVCLASLSLFLAVVANGGEPNTPVPDAIYFDGKIVTVDSDFSYQQAFATRGDRFVAVGENAKILALAGDHTRLVNLKGATVIPGFADSHDHLWNSTKYLFRGVDMIGVTTLAEMQDRLRVAVAKADPRDVVFTTTGWTINPAPTRNDLDSVSSKVPIVAIRYRRGVGVMNSAALARLGISKANPEFNGVKVPVDPSGEPLGTPPGYPTGVLMIDALLPPLTVKQQDLLVKQAMEQRNSLGITSIRELAIWPAAVKALQRMRREGKLTVRMALGLEFPDQAATAKHLVRLSPLKREDHWLFLDSVAEEPWTPGTTPQGKFIELVREMNRLGWRPAPHVGSDLLRGITADDATDQTLTAYEAVDRESPLLGKRWYVEHVPFALPPEMQRMAKLGLVVSTQDAGYKHVTAAPLPPERMAHQNPIREFLDHKLVVIGGSDYSGPTAVDKVPNNPMIPFYFYVTRKAQDGDITTAAEGITREEALRIFTSNAAYATFQEKIKGQISPGMLADFVILNQDLMTVPDEKILETRPVATFVGGRRVYSTPGSLF